MPRFNYVNSYPVTSIRYGIQTLSPKYFGGAPDIAVAGFNVGGKQLSKVPFHRTHLRIFHCSKSWDHSSHIRNCWGSNRGFKGRHTKHRFQWHNRVANCMEHTCSNVPDRICRPIDQCHPDTSGIWQTISCRQHLAQCQLPSCERQYLLLACRLQICAIEDQYCQQVYSC